MTSACFPERRGMQAVLALREAALREWAVLNPGQRLALLRFLVEQVCRDRRSEAPL
jgi:hypothetical protein